MQRGDSLCILSCTLVQARVFCKKCSDLALIAAQLFTVEQGAEVDDLAREHRLCDFHHVRCSAVSHENVPILQHNSVERGGV